MVGLALLALAGRKYIRERDIKIPRITDVLSDDSYNETSVEPAK
jgi:hypothetical protein